MWENKWSLQYGFLPKNNKGYLLGVETFFTWQPLGGPQIEINNASNKSQALFELQSDIHIPLESKVSLNNLLHCMEQILKHNFISVKYCSDSLYEDAFLFAAGVLTGIMAVPYEVWRAVCVKIMDFCIMGVVKIMGVEKGRDLYYRRGLYYTRKWKTTTISKAGRISSLWFLVSLQTYS